MATTPYSSIQNSFAQISGAPPIPNTRTGPIGYNLSNEQLRPQERSAAISPFGTGTPEDRITAMANKQYEKWAAGNELRSQQATEIEAAKKAALGGVDFDPRLTGNITFGGNKEKYKQNDFQSFVSNEGVPGLFGGSTSGPESRYSDWNKLVGANAKKYSDALTPVWSKYGLQPDNLNRQSLW